LCLLGLIEQARDAGRVGDVRLHGDGAPALPDNFTALPYVNPDAPQGGRLIEGVLGTFDSLNPFIVQGLAVQPVRGYVIESLMARSYDEPFTLYGYPLATVIAEKLTTAIALGDFSTRDRDYADLYRVITLNDLDGAELTRALAATAAHRGITLQPLSASITDIATRHQNSYTAWRLRQAAASASYPDSFAEVVQLVISFSDPLITGKTATRRWTAASRTWT